MNHSGGIVLGLGGRQILFFYVFLGHSFWGRKAHKQNQTQNPGTIPTIILFMCYFVRLSKKPKRGRTAGRGRPTKNVTTICSILRQFPTFYDNFRLFLPLTQNVVNRYKMSLKALRHFRTTYDRFFAVPCLPSPFGFRRVVCFFHTPKPEILYAGAPSCWKIKEKGPPA